MPFNRITTGILNTVVHRTSVAMCLVDPSGRFVWANGAYLDLVGYRASELCRLTWMQITVGDTEQVSPRTDAITIHKTYRMKNGQEIAVRLLVRAIQDRRQPLFLIEAFPLNESRDDGPSFSIRYPYWMFFVFASGIVWLFYLLVMAQQGRAPEAPRLRTSLDKVRITV